MKTPDTNSNTTSTVTTAVSTKNNMNTYYNNNNNKFNHSNNNNNSKGSSIEEQWGFVLHVVMVLSFMYYLYLWCDHVYNNVITIQQLQSQQQQQSFDIVPSLSSILLSFSYQQRSGLNNKDSSTSTVVISIVTILSIVLIVLFFTIPIIYYSICQLSSVATRSSSSMSIIQDTYTIIPPSSPHIRNSQNLYHIHYEYYRNPMQYTNTQHSETTSTTTTTTMSSLSSPSSSLNLNSTIMDATAIPEICDIDVADINDLIWCTRTRQEMSNTIIH